MIPPQILDQVANNSIEGLVLALASKEDGAVMELRWCNEAFTKTTGFEPIDIVGQRGSVLIGSQMPHRQHLNIMERLMNWEHFSISALNNRKNGDKYWQQMSWVPLYDTTTGERWWLCSIVENPKPFATEKRNQRFSSVSADNEHSRDYIETIQRLEKENARLQELAEIAGRESNQDALTGLSNRRHFEVELRSRLSNLGKGGADFAVLYIDLDRFKTVNDTFGHDAGDRLLVAVSNILQGLIDTTDFLARIGGDEFIILRRLGETALSISTLADKIVERMQEPIAFDGQSASSSASIGVAIADKTIANPDQVVIDADRALYQAKQLGRARWSLFTEEMHAEMQESKWLSADMIGAFQRDEFTLFFQPVVEAETGAVVSAEVLLRWRHPTKGMLLPGTFLKQAASMGLLRQIDALVFRKTCEALANLDRTGVFVPRVSINSSAERLADANFMYDIKNSYIKPERLIIEVLESVSLDQMSNVMFLALNELREMGVTIAVDDFGAGNASLQGLLQIKPTILKIDRQFIQPIVECDVSRDLAASIVEIGKNLGMDIVAEGVETELHAALLARMGCAFLQGYYFGKPMSLTDFHDYMANTDHRV